MVLPFAHQTVTEILIRKPDLITSRKVFMCTRWMDQRKIEFFVDDTLVYTFQPERIKQMQSGHTTSLLYYCKYGNWRKF
jgi:hypothetical protein